jgi:hypothetical protein
MEKIYIVLILVGLLLFFKCRKNEVIEGMSHSVALAGEIDGVDYSWLEHRGIIARRSGVTTLAPEVQNTDSNGCTFPNTTISVQDARERCEEAGDNCNGFFTYNGGSDGAQGRVCFKDVPETNQIVTVPQPDGRWAAEDIAEENLVSTVIANAYYYEKVAHQGDPVPVDSPSPSGECPDGYEMECECVDNVVCHESCLTCGGEGVTDCLECADGSEIYDPENDGSGSCPNSGGGGESSPRSGRPLASSLSLPNIGGGGESSPRLNMSTVQIPSSLQRIRLPNIGSGGGGESSP